MCLIGLAIGQHPRFELVVAANRDEFLQRPAAAVDWWQATADDAPLLGGRDLRAGGTWMGLNARGRVGMLTNVRDMSRQRADAPSRGAIVPAWLASDAGVADFWRGVAAQGHNPFNLLCGDIDTAQWWWADDRAAAPTLLAPGLYGLSNAALDTPWPKVQRLKNAMSTAIEIDTSSAALEAALFTALSDHVSVPDEALPRTGIGLERERSLAPAFIRTPDALYGTRCSTLLIVERRASGLGVHFIERQFALDGSALSQRRAQLQWPLQAGKLPTPRQEALSAG